MDFIRGYDTYMYQGHTATVACPLLIPIKNLRCAMHRRLDVTLARNRWHQKAAVLRGFSSVPLLGELFCLTVKTSVPPTSVGMKFFSCNRTEPLTFLSKAFNIQIVHLIWRYIKLSYQIAS